MTIQAHQPDLGSSHPDHDDAPAIRFRPPQPADGPAIHALIASCPPLDANSLYCNLLQASHFGECCILAELSGQPVGWVSGYRLPADPLTLFVWQVAVDDRVRGQGLAGRMLAQLLRRPHLADIRQIQTTITPSNQASWSLFQRFAEQVGARIQNQRLFDRDTHFGGAHESEHLVTIGPLPPVRAAA